MATERMKRQLGEVVVETEKEVCTLPSRGGH